MRLPFKCWVSLPLWMSCAPTIFERERTQNTLVCALQQVAGA